MNHELYEPDNDKLELYKLLDEGRKEAEAGKKRPYKDVFRDIEQDIIDGKL